MKIFGKKRKKSTAAAVNRQDAAADAIVLKLLADKPDPATRNAKERRLVKRYEERQQQQLKEQTVVETGKEDSVEDDALVGSETRETEAEQDASSVGDEEKSSSEEDEEAEDEEKDDGESETNEATESFPEAISTETPEPVSTESTTHGDNDTSTLPADTLALLNQIPSKQRRKLVRQWERREATAQQVHEQANLIVNPPGTANKRDADAIDSTSEQPKAKRRKKTIDESLLSPEERLRRQEQRRLQQEAKEKREKGLVKGSKRHPLNSERRRANRRKPKWEKKPSVGTSYKSEHASSGYHIRKTQKA